MACSRLSPNLGVSFAGPVVEAVLGCCGGSGGGGSLLLSGLPRWWWACRGFCFAVFALVAHARFCRLRWARSALTHCLGPVVGRCPAAALSTWRRVALVVVLAAVVPAPVSPLLVVGLLLLLPPVPCLPGV